MSLEGVSFQSNRLKITDLGYVLRDGHNVQGHEKHVIERLLHVTNWLYGAIQYPPCQILQYSTFSPNTIVQM